MPHPITSSSVFLVSGGARGITAWCVIRLAQQYRCKFILLGRSSRAEREPAYAIGCADETELKKRIAAHLARARQPHPQGSPPTPVEIQKCYQSILASREVEQTLGEVARAGGQAEYLSVDITEAPALLANVADAEQRLGPVTAILHGAGALADGYIEKKTGQDFEAVFAPKIAGLETLLACVSLDRLQYLVLFSSAAGFYGNPGQSDYALANEILNKAAHYLQKRYPACRVLAINWGPWDGGMVTPALKRVFEARRVEVIPPDVGAQILVDELERGSAVQVLVGGILGGTPKPIDHALHHFYLHRRLTLADNPFLRDHIINGQAVLPATAAVVWMANAAEQRYPGYTFYTCEDFKVYQGIVFDDGLADEYTLELKELAKQPGRLVFQALLFSEGEGRPRPHYQARLTLLDQKAPAPAIPTNNWTENNPLDGAILYEDGTLFHGPAFRSIERVLSLDHQHLLARCRVPKVPERDQGQFPIQAFNPFVADTGLQALVVAVRRLKGVSSLPLGVRQVFHFGDPRPGDIFYIWLEILSLDEMQCTANIYARAEDNRCYFQWLEAQVTLSQHLNDLFLLNRLSALNDKG